MRIIRAIVGLEGIVVVAAIVLIQTRLDPAAIPPTLTYVPVVVLATGAFLTWRFYQSRLLLGLLVLVLADRGLLLLGHDVPAAVEFSRQAIAVLLPVNLLALTLFAERGLATPWGLVRVVVLGAQAVWIALWCCPEPPPALAFLHTATPLPESWTAWTPVGQIALLLYAAVGIFMMVRLGLKANATGRGFLWAMVATVAALSTVAPAPVPTLYFSVAGLVLGIAVIEASYFMAYRDPLTGLPARRALDEAMMRVTGQYTVAMVDVDHFKQFNDRYGHDVGDQVLRMVAKTLQSVEGGGQAYRYGGEEFAIVFSGRGADDAEPFLEGVRQKLADSKFTIRGPNRPKKKPERPLRRRAPAKQVTVTVSIGVASRPDRRSAPSEVIALADKALYEAKRAGRNRTRQSRAVRTA